MLSMREAQFIIPDRKALYQSLQRNGYSLPPIKDPILTVKFMKGVRSGFFFCLKQEQVQHFKQCATPPPRHELAVIVCDVMCNTNSGLGEPYDSGIQRTAKEILKKKPNVAC